MDPVSTCGKPMGFPWETVDVVGMECLQISAMLAVTKVFIGKRGLKKQ